MINAVRHRHQEKKGNKAGFASQSGQAFTAAADNLEAGEGPPPSEGGSRSICDPEKSRGLNCSYSIFRRRNSLHI